MAKEATTAPTNSFRRVTPRSKQRKRNKRYPMIATVLSSGRCLLNVTSFAGIRRLALGKGLDGAFHVILAVNEATGTVAVYVVPVDEPDSLQVRRLSENKLSFSLDDVLDELPDLRPTGRVKCSVMEIVDDKGEACLVINLGAQLTHARRHVQEAAAAQATEKKS